jgi:GAF domain-containing protein
VHRGRDDDREEVRDVAGPTPVDRATPATAVADGAVGRTYGEALDELAGVVLDAPTMHGVLEQLIEIARHAAPGTTAISVTSYEDGEYVTAATTDPAARRVDQYEYATEAGPCVDAIETGELQLSVDVLADDRWPTFSEVAAEAGFRSVAGVPLRAGDRTVGALNLYAAEPDGLREVLALAERLAGPLATVVANAIALRRMARLGDHLQDELAQLATVEQAIGVLMARRAWDAPTAQRVLRETAEATGRSVDEVATELVAHADRPGPRR